MTTQELIVWLRQNSSGIFRPAAEAADRLEELERELAAMTEQFNRALDDSAEIKAYGNAVIDAAAELRHQLTTAIIERDEAINTFEKRRSAMDGTKKCVEKMKKESRNIKERARMYGA